MSISQFSTFILLFNLVITFLNVFLWLYFVKRLQDIKHKETELDGSFSRIVEHAHVKSESILESAAEQANSILNETRSLKESVDKDLQEAVRQSMVGHSALFNDISKRVTLSYEEALKDLRHDVVGQAAELNEKLKKLAEDNIKLYEGIIREEASTAQISIQEKVDKEFAEAKKDIQQYRMNEMAYIDKSIAKIISTITKDIIGREITLADKQNLLYEALDKAKKEGIFNN